MFFWSTKKSKSYFSKNSITDFVKDSDHKSFFPVLRNKSKKPNISTTGNGIMKSVEDLNI